MRSLKFVLVLTIPLVVVAYILSGCGGQLSPGAMTNDGDQVQAEAAITPGANGLAKVLIGFNQHPGAAEEAQVRARGGLVTQSYSIVPAVAASVPPQAVDALRKDPNVAYVEADAEAWALEDTLVWGADRIDADVVWGGVQGAVNVNPSRPSGTGAKVAIVDTGIDYTHPDLSANYVGGYDFVNSDTDPRDDNGHGTHCAGIVAAADNGIGVIEVAPTASLTALKVLNASGSGYYSNIAAALDWCVSHGIQVASMSFGGTYDSTTLHAACDKAYAAGVLLVAAAGNSGNRRGTGDNVNFPARYSSVIAVAATDTSNQRASFSSTGPTVELAAPGVNILSTYLGGAYATMSGTSMACPHVTGTAALVISSGVATSAAAVRNRLDATAKDLGTKGRDAQYGYGLVNAKAATGL